MIVGVLAGLASTVVELGLHAAVPALVGRFTHLGGAQLLEPRLAILLLPALGGLVSGVLVAWLCPPGKLGGTEAAVRAFHHEGWADEGRERLVREHTCVRAREHEGRLGALLSRMPETRRHAARRWPVPAEVVGRSLREARVRNTYGIDVIAVQTLEGEFLTPPDPDRPLAAGDVLVVLGAGAAPPPSPPAGAA